MNLLNILFSVFLVYFLKWELTGVALGTLIAQYFGMIYLILHFRGHHLISDSAKWLFDPARFNLKKSELFININILIRSMSLLFAFAYFTTESALFGATLLALNTVLMQFVEVLSYALDGFAHAAESLVGKYFGAKDRTNYVRAISRSFYWSTLVAVGFTAIFWGFGSGLMKIFTSIPEVLELADEYFIWIIIAPLLNSFAYIWDGIYVGKTATVAMRNAMIFSLTLYLLVFYFVKMPWQSHGLWFAFSLFMLSRSLTLWYLSKHHIFEWGLPLQKTKAIR